MEKSVLLGGNSSSKLGVLLCNHPSHEAGDSSNARGQEELSSFESVPRKQYFPWVLKLFFFPLKSCRLQTPSFANPACFGTVFSSAPQEPHFVHLQGIRPPRADSAGMPGLVPWRGQHWGAFSWSPITPIPSIAALLQGRSGTLLYI